MALSVCLGGFSEITSFLKGRHYRFWRMCRHVLCQARYHFSATQNLWQKIFFVHKRKERFATGDLPIGCPAVDFILMSNGRTVAFYWALQFLISLSQAHYNSLYPLFCIERNIVPAEESSKLTVYACPFVYEYIVIQPQTSVLHKMEDSFS